MVSYFLKNKLFIYKTLCFLLRGFFLANQKLWWRAYWDNQVPLILSPVLRKKLKCSYHVQPC